MTMTRDRPDPHRGGHHRRVRRRPARHGRPAGRRGLRPRTQHLERGPRSPPGGDRPLRRCGRRDPHGRSRPQRGAAAGGSRRRPFDPRLFHRRRRNRAGPVADEGDPGGPRPPPGDGAGRLYLEGPGRRDPAVRAGGDRWPGVLDRHRRLHHRRRHRLADAQVRAGRATTWSAPTSSPLTGSSFTPVPMRTPSCSGGCAAAAAISVW